MKELKNCPCCGGESHIHSVDLVIIGERYGTMCKNCPLNLGCIYPTEQEAIDAWNRRTDEQWGEVASDNTGYSLTCDDGMYCLFNEKGYVVCEFIHKPEGE